MGDLASFLTAQFEASQRESSSDRVDLTARNGGVPDSSGGQVPRECASLEELPVPFDLMQNAHNPPIAVRLFRIRTCRGAGVDLAPSQSNGSRSLIGQPSE